MKNRLYSFLTKFKLFSPSQYGLLRGISKVNAMINLIEQLFKYVKIKNLIYSVIVDLRKAFDTVNRMIFLRKLENLSIRGMSLKIFRNHVANRQQLVCLIGTNSSLKQISIGVPQGRISDPIFFQIYINDLSGISSSVSITFLSDETTVTLSGKI